MDKFLTGLFIVLLGVAAVGVAVTVRYRSEIRAVQEHIDSLGSQVVMTDCGPIEYARTGTGYPILSIHGNGGGFDQGVIAGRSLPGGRVPDHRPISVWVPLARRCQPGPPRSSRPMHTPACWMPWGSSRSPYLPPGPGSHPPSSLPCATRSRLSAMVLHSPNAPGKVEVQLPPRPVFPSRTWQRLPVLAGRKSNMISMFVPKELPLTDQMAADVRPSWAKCAALQPSRKWHGFRHLFRQPGNQPLSLRTG